VAGRHSRKLLTRLVRVLHYGWLTKVLSDWACGAAALHCRRNALLAQRGEGLRCARLVVAMRGWREALERWRGGLRVWGGWVEGVVGVVLRRAFLDAIDALCSSSRMVLLRHAVTCCHTLQHTVAHCKILQHAATYCSTLQYTAAHCSTLQHTAAHCSTLQTLQHTATRCRHCRTLQHAATHCNTLQYTAIHCNTLQHTATHCNALQQFLMRCSRCSMLFVK